MAEPIITGNGSGNGAGVSIPAPSFEEQGKAWSVGALAAGWVDDLVRKNLLSRASGPGTLLGELGSLFDDLMAVFVQFVGSVQAGGTPGFFTLLSSVLGDLIGVEISADQVHNAWVRGGARDAFRTVGADYWKALLGQIGSPAQLTPESGLAAAEGFLGYLLGFSIREGNIAMLASVIPEEWRIMDGIDEYAQAMRASLGLGRMARQALHPLIQTLITDPLQWYVNRQYTPKLLGEGLAVRAFIRGWVPREVLDTELAYAGYSPARIETLIKDALTELSPADAYTLYKAGAYTEQQVAAAARTSGQDPAVFGDWITAKIAAEVEPYTSALIADWKGQLLGGFITLAKFEGYVNSLKLPQEVKDAVNNAVGQLVELPRRKLTLAEVQSAFVEGLIDSTEVADWLTKEGYSDDDAQILWYQTLLKLNTTEAKKAVAKYGYDKAVAKAAAKGEPPPPPPAILAV